MTDASLWHPWLRINRVLPVMLQPAVGRRGVVRRPCRVQAGTRAADPARGVVQLASGETVSEEAREATRLTRASA